MTNLLSPEQLDARARFRRERLSDQAAQEGVSEWPIVVEGWSEDRQMFGFVVAERDAIAGAVAVARSALNVDTVVVYSDSRMFSVDPKLADSDEVYAQYQRGEVTLLQLAQRGDPRVTDLLFILPFSIERGALEARSHRYITRYAFSQEVGLVWDLEDEPLVMPGEGLTGRVPEALTWAMQETGVGADFELVQPGDGKPLLWEQFDAGVLLAVAGLLERVSHGRFVILNAHPKIAEAAGFAPGGAPGRIVIGNREPEVVTQLVAREVKAPAA